MFKITSLHSHPHHIHLKARVVGIDREENVLVQIEPRENEASDNRVLKVERIKGGHEHGPLSMMSLAGRNNHDAQYLTAHFY